MPGRWAGAIDHSRTGLIYVIAADIQWDFLPHSLSPFSYPNRSAESNQGGYLIESPGHCAECHTLGDMEAIRPMSDPTEVKGVQHHLRP